MYEKIVYLLYFFVKQMHLLHLYIIKNEYFWIDIWIIDEKQYILKIIINFEILPKYFFMT